MNSVLCNKNFLQIFKNHFRKGWSKIKCIQQYNKNKPQKIPQERMERKKEWKESSDMPMWKIIAYKWIYGICRFYIGCFVKKILYCCLWMPELTTVSNRTMLVTLCSVCALLTIRTLTTVFTLWCNIIDLQKLLVSFALKVMKGDTYFNTCAEEVRIVFADLHGLLCRFPQWAVFSATCPFWAVVLWNPASRLSCIAE